MEKREKTETGELLRVMGITLFIFAVLGAIIHISLFLELIGAIVVFFAGYLMETEKMKLIESSYVKGIFKRKEKNEDKVE